MIVVKLGGSLYDHPFLRVGLNRWLGSFSSRVLFVPGGGPLADGVRDFDRLHGVGDRIAHEAALQSMMIAGELLEAIITKGRVRMLDNYWYRRMNHQLPHSWDVTSDSIALCLAMMIDSEKLILLKSLARPKGDWETLAKIGYVDQHFPILAKTTDVPIEVVNFRSYLDDYRNVESK